MLARAALVASAVLLAFVLGLTTFTPAPPPVGPAHPLRLASLRLDPPGAAATAAADTLAGFHPAPASAAPVVAASPRPVVEVVRPPPPPQADAVLRSSLTAVADDHGRLGLVLAGQAPGRRLHEGDAFMGWRIASITHTGAVLSKGAARRDVSFFAPGPRDAVTAAASGMGAAPPPGVLPPSRPAAPMSRPPTAAEFFRGFKG